jgi:ATP-dependent DNA helicase RecQ
MVPSDPCGARTTVLSIRGMPETLTSPNADPTKEMISGALRSVFGFDSLRPLQEEVIMAVMHHRDTFVLMPTGGGKSLCYQLPAVLMPGVTVVVSPLIALMKDQVDKLVAAGVAATFINSSLDYEEARRRQADVVAGKVKLLYVAPERLMIPTFLSMLEHVDVSLFAIDEAHCISEWGHDFRPEYRALSELRSRFPDVPIAAFTATATQGVQDDIRSQLALREPVSVRGSLDRPNIRYQVWPKRDSYRSLLGFLQTKPGESGIIYVQSRASADGTAERLRRDGVRALAYHAGMEGEERHARQDAFLKDEVDVMVATIAFGMGIDKPDIRYVVHLDLPKNLEGYYQESGRAGRDGQAADAVLFYSYGDAMKHEFFIQEKPEGEQRIARMQLEKMVAWAKSPVCRRESLLGYFDEALQTRPDPCCDACEAPVVEESDHTVVAQMFLSCAKRTGESFGAVYLTKVLMGARDKRVLANQHDELPTYGIGRDKGRDEWAHIAGQLADRGYVSPDPERGNGLSVTELGDGVLFRKEEVWLPMWQDRSHGGHGKPRPVSRPQLSAGESARESIELFRAGTALRDIASTRGFSPVTIEGHLAQGVQNGDLDIEDLVASDKRLVIEETFLRVGGSALKPIKEALGDAYSYAEIKFVRAGMSDGDDGIDE